MLGDALAIPDVIDTGRVSSPWAIRFFDSRTRGGTIMRKTDNHLGVFYPRAMLPKIVEKIRKIHGRNIKNFVSLRLVDAADEPLLDLAPNQLTWYHTDARDDVSGAIRSITDSVRSLEEQCRRYGFSQPPARGYDIMVMPLSTSNAEQLATRDDGDFDYLLEKSGIYHVPMIFLIDGDPKECESFVDKMNRMVFFGRPNMAYIRSRFAGARVMSWPENNAPLGYEPYWDERRQEIVLDTIYSRQTKSGTENVTRQVRAANAAAYDDFLSGLD